MWDIPESDHVRAIGVSQYVKMYRNESWPAHGRKELTA